MAQLYNKQQLREIFQSPFNQEAWKAILHNLFRAEMIRKKLEKFTGDDDNEDGFFLGALNTSDSFRIGLFYFVIKTGSVAHKKVGLRNLVKQFVNPTWGEFDAAIVVFNDKREWRLSFVCDIKDVKTAPKRYTFVFGEHDNFYRTAIDRFLTIQNSEPTFENIRKAFSVDALSDDFFDTYRKYYADFVQYITGKRYVKEGNKWVERELGKPNFQYTTTFDCNDKLVRDYVKKMFGRIVFLYFLQRKGWLNGDRQYMHNLFYDSTAKDNFLDGVLEPLFFEVLNTDKQYRTADANALPGSENIPYLNGGLFARDEIDELDCVFPEDYFKKLFDFLDSYNFTIDENDVDDAEIGIDPEMLGRIFENLLEDNKDKGAFYTPKEIVNYMCRESLIAYLQNGVPERSHELIRNFVENCDASQLNADQSKYLRKKLQDVKICDPAIGSGAFPMGLVNILSRLYIAMKADTDTSKMKRHIIENNIYGVDIEKGAVDIARLRFWLAMIVEEKEPMPLPNLHFKIMQGNSLLESIDGIDLSDLTKTKATRNLFDSTDTERENLKTALSHYYNTSNHTERDRLFNEIINNVRRQIYAKDPNIDQTGLDPSANDKFFLWHTWFADVFDNGGFDIVIGNPPYIDAKKLKQLAPLLKVFSIYTGTADIFTYFYEQGVRLSKKNGIITMITSNKWMRSEYGRKLRTFCLSNTILQLLDFGTNRLFNATVDTNILILKKGYSTIVPVICSMESCNNFSNLFYYALSNRNIVNLTEESWLIKKGPKDIIHQRLNNISDTLVSNNVSIYRGVVTGLNEAFIVSKETMLKILSHCDRTNFEKTQALFNPLIRGKDVDRYHSHRSELWLISLFPSLHYNIDDFPAIKEFLLGFGVERLEQSGKKYGSFSARKKTKNKWFETQDQINYCGEFLKPKIIWQAVSKRQAYCYDGSGTLYPDVSTFFMTGDNLKYILGILNSKLFEYALINIYLEGDTFKSKNKIIQNFPVPKPDGKVSRLIEDQVNKILDLKVDSISEFITSLDCLVYHLYKLSYEEVIIVDPQTTINKEEYNNFKLNIEGE